MNYPGTTYKLSGCVNDINNIEKLLIEKFNFKNIVKLHDSSSILPTKINILLQLKLLLSQSNSGDVLFFHYSGHGGLIKDTNGDEICGSDSCIYPIYENKIQVILDDETLLVEDGFHQGVKQTAVEWLHEIAKQREPDKFDWKQAKEMEKEQIIEAWNIRAKIDGVLTYTDNRTAEQYYKETFKQQEQ
jgi:hypothetical protein